MEDRKALIAEFIGTFILIYIGAGSVVVSAGNVLIPAFAHGLVVLGIAFAYGHISGAHLNPAVSIAMVVSGHMQLDKALRYIGVQMLAGVVGAAVLRFSLGSFAGGLGATIPADNVSLLQTFVIEVLLTFILVNAIYHTAVSGKAGNLAPIAIGLTLVACILMGGPWTGASLNPARSLGPALFSTARADALASLWIYLIACPLGGVLAALLYENVLKD